MTICLKGTQLMTELNAGLKDNNKKDGFLGAKPTKLSETVRLFVADQALAGEYAAYLDGLPEKLQDDVIRTGRQALKRGDQLQIDISFTHSALDVHSSITSAHIGGGVVTTITLNVPPPT